MEVLLVVLEVSLKWYCSREDGFDQSREANKASMEARPLVINVILLMTSTRRFWRFKDETIEHVSQRFTRLKSLS